jgi:SSS family solute:Na+ symporter
MKAFDSWVFGSIPSFYLLYILVKGLRCGKMIKTVDDYLLGGRSFAWKAILCTASATIMGGGASIGALEKIVEWGYFMIILTCAWYLQLMISGFFFAEKFRKEKVYTLPEFLGKHFGLPTRVLGAVLSVFFSMGILAAQFLAFGQGLHGLMPSISLSGAIACGAIVVLLYNWSGGLHAVIETDKTQFYLLIGGFAVVTYLCMDRMEWRLELFSLDMLKPKTILSPWLMIGMFVTFFFGEMFAPSYVTRFCAAQTPRDAKWGYVGSGLLLMFTFPILLFVISIYVRTQMGEVASGNLLSKLLLHLNSPWIAGLMMAALMAAVMSSADSILNSVTGILAKDILEPLRMRTKRFISNPLLECRILCLLLGAMALTIAISIPDIIKLLLFVYGIWAPSMLFPVLMACFPSLKIPIFPQTPLILICSGIAGVVAFRFLISDDSTGSTLFGLSISAGCYGVLWARHVGLCATGRFGKIGCEE